MAGCTDSTLTPGISNAIPYGAIPAARDFAPGLVVDDQTLAAADPSLPGFDGWPIVFGVSVPRAVSVTCEVVVRRGGTTITTLVGEIDGSSCSAVWNGLEGGSPARVGALAFEARLVDRTGSAAATTTQAVEVVRLGIDRIDVTGDRHPLLYRRMGGRRDGWSELLSTEAPFAMGANAIETGASAVELEGGMRRPIPGVWNDLLTPPRNASSADGRERDNYSLPFAIVAGSAATVTARVATEAAGGVSGDAEDAEIRIVAPSGFTISGEDRAAHGNLIVLEPTAPLAPGVGRFDIPMTFGFEARRMGGAWQPVPGSLPVTVRAYGLVGAPVFYGMSVPHRTWVDVIDRIAEWVGGTTADPNMVGAAIQEGVFFDSGLRYDTARGASFYTDYASFDFGGAVFEMQAFEERDYGTVVNCSDSASILSTYANMVGLDFRYHILRHRFASGFDLNFIQAIGVGRFDDTPFDTGRGGFSYHAIVGARDGNTWDATLAVDGDGAPAAAPNTLLLPQGLPPRMYLDALSSEAANILTTHDARVRIR